MENSDLDQIYGARTAEFGTRLAELLKEYQDLPAVAITSLLEASKAIIYRTEIIGTISQMMAMAFARAGIKLNPPPEEENIT